MCPNINNEQIRNEFNEIVTALGGNPLTIEEFRNKELRLLRTGTDAAAMDAAYDIWDQNQGNPIDKAPNGSESILFKSLINHYGDRQKAIRAKANTYSEAFKNWFGDWTSEDTTNVSKVVDENGEPLVVYHGNRTNTPIAIFDKQKIGSEHRPREISGFWFITDPRIAKIEYASKPESFGTGNVEFGEVLPVFLNIKTPIVAQQQGIETGFDPHIGNYTSVQEDLKSFIHRAKQIGDENTDGYVLTVVDSDNDADDYRSKQTQLVVFEPNQIKHIDNNGNFSTVDNNIYHQKKTGINNRRKHFTTEEWALSQRLSTVLRQLFPEISVEFVDSIEGGYVGEIDLNALKVLIDNLESGLDTIPHEYAHYYIAMFKGTPLVQKGIETFGSEEALVQAVGVRTVEMEGKARNWWQKFIDFIKKMLNKNKLAKQMLLAEITDAFLERRQLGQTSDILSGVKHQEMTNMPIEAARKILNEIQEGIVLDPETGLYIDTRTGKKLIRTTMIKEQIGYSDYDPSAEDDIQKKMSKNARERGTAIHKVMECLFENKPIPQDVYQMFAKDSIKYFKAIVDKISEKYDYVASEVTLSDPEVGIAGTADLIVREKATGEYILLDYKTKLLKLDGKDKNEKGRPLHGFKYVLSRKFGTISQSDGYDLQLSIYSKMLEKKGIKIARKGIIPITYYISNDYVTAGYISSIYRAYREDLTHKEGEAKLKENGFYELITPQFIKDDVNLRVFKDFSEIKEEEAKKRTQMIKDTRRVLDKVITRLNIQHEILKLRKRSRSQAYDAKRLLEKISELEELEALFKYAEYATKQLQRLNDAIEKRYKQGDEATWDLDVLQDYREVANGYSIINDITGLAHKYRSILGDERVRALDIQCNKLSELQRNIVAAYNSEGTRLFIDAITPYISRIEYKYKKEATQKYKEKHPNASQKDIDAYVAKYIEENREEIEFETKEWLRQQSEIAENIFECGGLSVSLDSVYYSKDPFVQAFVKMFDYKMSIKQMKVNRYRAKLAKAVKEFQKKYGVGNTSILKDVYKDFVEVSETGQVYLISPQGIKYRDAERKAKEEIFDSQSELSFAEKQEKFKKWLDVNCPIHDIAAYNQERESLLNAYFEEEENKEVRKKELQIIKENEKLPVNQRKSLGELYRSEKISSETKDFLEITDYELEVKYRKPDRTLYKNEKYDKMMQLKQTNDPKFALYQVLVEGVSEMDSQINRNLRLNGRLPGIYKRGMERVAANGAVSALKSGIQQSSLIMKDDTIRGTFVDQQGNPIRSVPMFYIGELNEDEQSFDLPTIYLKWYDSAQTHVAKREIESFALQTANVLSTRKTYDKNKVSLLGKNKSNQQKERTSSFQTNTRDQFEGWLNTVFYGNSLEDIGGFETPTGHKVDIAKLIKLWVKLTSNRVMMLNPVSLFNNPLVGEINQLEEALCGQFVSLKSYKRATKLYATGVFSMAKDYLELVPNNQYNRLAEYFNIFDSDFNLSLKGLLRHSFSDYGYLTTHIGEHEMQVRFMLASLIELQAKDKDGNVLGSMLDFIKINDDMELEVDDKVANFNRDDVTSFSLQLRQNLILLHGNYSDRASVLAESKWYGIMGLSLRRWIASNFNRRFAAEYYDEILGDNRKGFYRWGAQYAFIYNPYVAPLVSFVGYNLLRLEKAKIQARKWNELSNTEKADFIRFLVEIGVAAFSYLAYSVLGSSGGDDDEPNVVVSNIRYHMYRLYTDLTFFVNPLSFTKILKDPFPSITYINDIIGAFTQVFSPLEEYQSGEHLFDNKLLNKTARIFPVVKQIGRLSNIDREMESFQRMM